MPALSSARRWTLCALAFVTLPALAATPERLSDVSNGEIVGTLVATTTGNRVTVDYKVDDNGRGPKHREEIVLDAGGVPVGWAIQGTSLMGGPVSERFAWVAGRAS